MAQGWRVSTTRRHLEKRARTHVVSSAGASEGQPGEGTEIKHTDNEL